MFGKTREPSDKFSVINVQNLNINFVLLSYAVLLIIHDLRHGFPNSDALCKPQTVVVHK